ncbi:MAG TPA: GIY-YIG nuclease family protein [archaeon]|nr:GIY-YIG nuclease family protein [archaeon]
MAYFVYLAKCSDGSYYCGIAKNLHARIGMHNKGRGAKYTRSRRPVELAYFEKTKNKSAALLREIEIKKYSRKQKILLCKKWN